MPTAIEFFKLLPKTNCKDCGQPTCLAFAMQLANQKAKIEDCPHIEQSSKDTLNESAAPPVRTVSFGSKNKIDMGGETVLYRHERRFVNPTAYALTVSDSSNVKERIAYIEKLKFERVGTIFQVDAVNIKNDSDPAAFVKAVKEVNEIWDRPFILESSDINALKEALKICKDRKPLICSANASNIDQFIALAKEFSVPLALSSSSLEEMADMTEKAKKAGVEDLVIDTASSNLKQCIEKQTTVRRSALKKKFKAFGYPMMNRLGSGEYAIAMAVISTLKYGSLVIFDDLKSCEALPLFTLRQNIYTDPQVPIQVKQDLYPINEPNEHSPIFFTTNFSLTYFTVRADIEKSKMPVWLQIVNTEGLSVLTAYSAGKFNPEHVAKAFDESKALNRSDGIVVIPGLVARMSGKLQEMIQRDVIVGTKESKMIPKFLKELDAKK
jgi:CO dehydrogenase/acetyl-CoA synthase gamma subunit (corrinoid Fe-S protein)